MSYVIPHAKVENARMVLDPNDYWCKEGVTYEGCLQTGAMIAGWFGDYLAGDAGFTPYPKDEGVLAFLNHAYAHGGGCYKMEGGEVGEDLTYKYPGDPLLQPTFRVYQDDGPELVMWQHAMCAFRDNPQDDWYVTRMD